MGDATQASEGQAPPTEATRRHVQEQCAQNGLQLLPIEPPDIYGLAQLPSHHADPFDRLIVSQIKRCGFSVVTDDGEFAKYGVPIVW